jgi:GNAT superfamily N-acetyltransferase
MQQSKEWELLGFDLTIGEGDLKERFSNEQVVLPMVELYPSRRSHSLAAARDAARKGLRRLTGEERWRSKIRPLLKTTDLKLEQHLELGLGHMLGTAAGVLSAKLGQWATGLVLLVKPADIREVEPVLAPAETCAFHEDQAYDLLKWTGSDPQVSWHITAKARAFADAQRSGRTFHTVLVNDRLAGWGFSYTPSEPARLSETGGTPFEFLPNSVSLYDFYVLPEFRGRKLYPALLVHVLKKRFAEGAQQAYIAVLQSNQPSLKAIQRVGFQVIRRNRYMRLLRWARTVSSDVPYAG